jgi:hypothetical protein
LRPQYLSVNWLYQECVKDSRLPPLASKSILHFTLEIYILALLAMVALSLYWLSPLFMGLGSLALISDQQPSQIHNVPTKSSAQWQLITPAVKLARNDLRARQQSYTDCHDAYNADSCSADDPSCSDTFGILMW